MLFRSVLAWPLARHATGGVDVQVQCELLARVRTATALCIANGVCHSWSFGTDETAPDIVVPPEGRTSINGKEIQFKPSSLT